jgi:hypothetical protein
MRCALGFVAHTGWAAAVVVSAGEPPVVLDRRRIELVAGGFEAAAVYHASESLALAEARRVVDRARATAERSASEHIGAMLESLKSARHAVRTCAIVGAAKPFDHELASILRSHALIHAAEGELYRAALVAGAKAHGLEVVTVPARELDGGAKWLTAIGRELGPPWSKDQKLATLAARRALA